jgi:putative ATPase subunit gpP of terminase
MPHAIDLDVRELAKSLFLQGLTTTDIGKRVSLSPVTIKTWINRYNWRQLRANTQAIIATGKLSVQLGLQDITHQSASGKLTNASRNVREAMSASLTDLAAKLSNKPAKGLSEAMRRQALLEPAVRNAKVVFGWSDGAEPSIRIGVMNTAVVNQPGALPSPIGQQSNLISVSPGTERPPNPLLPGVGCEKGPIQADRTASGQDAQSPVLEAIMEEKPAAAS